MKAIGISAPKELVMASLNSLSTRSVWLAAGLTVFGCGSYVKYDGNDPTQGGGPVDAGDLGIDLAKAGTFDHSLFSSLLAEYVTQTGDQSTLDYDAIKDSAIASAALTSYRASLASADASSLMGQTQRLAFWLNAYNASVIAGVLADYKGDPEFRVIDSGLFFNSRVYQVAGLTVSLDEIEHGIIRGVWDHPSVAGSPSDARLRELHEELWGDEVVNARIHVALNCGALSCPNLLTKSWNPGTLPQDLQAALEAFLANPGKGAGGKGVSMLFTWFEIDFKNEAGSVKSFIEKNRKGGLSGVDLDKDLNYDWTLNIKG